MSHRNSAHGFIHSDSELPDGHVSHRPCLSISWPPTHLYLTPRGCFPTAAISRQPGLHDHPAHAAEPSIAGRQPPSLVVRHRLPARGRTVCAAGGGGTPVTGNTPIIHRRRDLSEQHRPPTREQKAAEVIPAVGRAPAPGGRLKGQSRSRVNRPAPRARPPRSVDVKPRSERRPLISRRPFGESPVRRY